MVSTLSTFGTPTRGIGRRRFLTQSTRREFRPSSLPPSCGLARDQACSRPRPARVVIRAAASDEGRAKRRRRSPHGRGSDRPLWLLAVRPRARRRRSQMLPGCPRSAVRCHRCRMNQSARARQRPSRRERPFRKPPPIAARSSPPRLLSRPRLHLSHAA